MNIWNTIKKDIPSGETKEVTVKNIHYRVEWESFHEEYGYAARVLRKEIEFLPIKEDAMAYAKSLRDAYLLTRSKQTANRVKLYEVIDGERTAIAF